MTGAAPSVEASISGRQLLLPRNRQFCVNFRSEVKTKYAIFKNALNGVNYWNIMISRGRFRNDV